MGDLIHLMKYMLLCLLILFELLMLLSQECILQILKLI